MLTPHWLLGALFVACLATTGAFAQSNLQIETGTRAPRSTRSYPRIEASFNLPDLQGDPLDFEHNDVRAQILLPDGKVLSLPAFFDGGTTWRVRHTPTAPGKYQVVSVTRNGVAVLSPIAITRLGVPVALPVTPSTFQVGGASDAGFIGLDPKNPRRFSFDSGARYYPLGTNQAWLSGRAGEYTARFAKMGASGQNWSRVWMNHWDGKNLDWAPDGKGGFSLDAARHWDEVVDAAAKDRKTHV